MSAAFPRKIIFLKRISASVAAARTLVSNSEDLGPQAHQAGQADAVDVAVPVEETQLREALLVPQPRAEMQLLRQQLLALPLWVETLLLAATVRIQPLFRRAERIQRRKPEPVLAVPLAGALAVEEAAEVAHFPVVAAVACPILGER